MNLNRSKNRQQKRSLRFESLEPRQMLTVVINEIHYNSADNTSAEEFVELYNTSASPVDLSGWAFTDGIDYTFQAGASIPGEGYVVVAQDPAVLLDQFGAIAIGQYSGSLSGDGENVELQDSLGNLIDEVDYNVGFPWPVASAGGGGSMELINPALDNNLGSSWRASYVEPLFPSPAPPIVAAAGSLSDLVHRWSFNGNLSDSVGGADATLVDPQGIATLTSTQLDVSEINSFTDNSNQTPFTEGAYVDLPNGIISSLGDEATFEWWGTVTFNRKWAEIFSFGTSSGGEDYSNGAGNEDYLTLIPKAGNGSQTLRVTHRDGTISQESFVDAPNELTEDVEQHIAVVWDGASNSQSLYLNGQFVGSSSTIIQLSDLDDNNNWLGRSQFPDPLFDGYHDEFRIYDRALSGSEIAASFADGPDADFSGPSINSFTVDDAELLPGQSATLSWSTTDADSLSINNGVGNVTGQTQIVVSPSETTTYTLTATNANGSTHRDVTIAVNVPRATPGLRNNAYAENAAPNIRQVNHDPSPTSGAPVLVTAKVTDPDGVSNVTLHYQVVLPGQYLPATLAVSHNDLISSNGSLEPTLNPDYVDPANWSDLTMVDDGTGGDAVAGDDIYSVLLPTQAHRTLVRYRITVEDTLGATDTAPFADDASLNFAYFVYDGVPDYKNAAGNVVADQAALNSLPVYQFLTRAEDMKEVVAYDSSDQIPQFNDARFSYNWSGTMVYNGQVYDNIHYRLRGANGRYQAEGKRSMRFRFNEGSWFQAYDQNGDAYPELWRTLTTGKGSENHLTLTYGLNEAVTLGMSNMLGLPAAKTNWFQFRVIDDANETDAYGGDFWGINFALETYDKRFLDAHDLPSGNLYKLVNQTTDALEQQRYQSADAVSDGSDHDYIEQQLNRNSDDIQYRVNLEKYYLFHTLVEATRNYDFWPTSNKNMVYYFEPDYLPENDGLGKLWLMPFDTDASWGPTWNEGHDVVYDALFDNNDSNYSSQLINPDYYNTLRELRDLIWQPDQLEGIIEEYASAILPLEAADRARWTGGPGSIGDNSVGSYNGLGGPGATSIADLVNDMMAFAFDGGNWPTGGSGGSGAGYVGPGGRAAYLDSELVNSGEEALIPYTPTITYTGAPNFAADGLQFQTTAYDDPQGSNTFGAVQWRISEVTPASAGLDPNEKFLDEWTANWDTGALTTNSTTIAPSAATVEVGQMQRARVRFQDDTGRWSHWSAPVEFTPAAAASLPALTITELNYHPNNPELVDEDDQEFIEILNTGNSTVDLSGVQIADFGSTPYVFSNGQNLAPGEYIVVPRSIAEFQSIYGASINLAADEYSPTNLSNGGETISLLTAGGATIESFTYDDKAPWPEAADGDGPSLEIIDPLGDHDDPSNWRASAEDGGSPGYDGAVNPLPGDYDNDQQVGGFDFLAWQRSYGDVLNPVGGGADGDHNGIVAGEDLAIWNAHYGEQLPPQSSSLLAASTSPADVENLTSVAAWARNTARAANAKPAVRAAEADAVFASQESTPTRQLDVAESLAQSKSELSAKTAENSADGSLSHSDDLSEATLAAALDEAFLPLA